MGDTDWKEIAALGLTSTGIMIGGAMMPIIGWVVAPGIVLVIWMLYLDEDPDD